MWKQLGWLCANVAILKDRTSPSNTDMRKESHIDTMRLVAEFVHRKVNIILVSGGAPPTRAAKNATKTIPIVMTGGGLDPVEAGLVESLAHPGGNVTGVTNLTEN